MTEIIPIADLPVVIPGATDHVLGTQLGDARQFPVAQLPITAAVTEALASVDARMDAVETAQIADMIGYTTKALMDADLAHPVNTLALVTNDATAANNQTYIKLGASGAGSWQAAVDRISSVSTRVATIEAETVPGVSYGFGSRTAVTNALETIVQDVTSPLASPHDLVFIGWGERFSPSGVTFNAIRLKKISQTAALTSSQWRQLFLVIRTGANSHLAAAPIVAVASVYVNTGKSPLLDVSFVLKDPITGALKSLNNASFSGGEYFIGVYAKNSVGGWASCGEPRGTVANELVANQSYYITSVATDPTAQTWTAASAGSNFAQGFQHLNMTTPVETLAFSPTAGLKLDMGDSTRLDVVEPKLAYVVNATSVVTAAATSVNLDVTSYSGFARDTPFFGWGERYTPPGVSFNALRIKAIARTATAVEANKWAQLKVIVRAGGSNTHLAGTVVAVGSAWVSREADALTDVTFLLKDPTTGAVKTLTDADLSTEYFIAVCAYNTAGIQATCGEPRGTMSNQLVVAQSYYCAAANTDPTLAAWTLASAGSNFAQGFQHLLLTTPVESVSYVGTQAFSSGLPVSIPAPEVDTPAYVFGLQGQETNLYFDNICLDDAATYRVNVDSSITLGGQQQAERWTWIPAAGASSGTLTVQFLDKRSGTLLSTNVIQQRAAATAAGSGLTKKCIVIGDSLVAAGTITQTMLNTSAGDVMHATMLGTQGTAPNQHEGRGGWTISDYSTAGRTFYSFTVSGVTTDPIINSTQYTNNGNTYQVQTVSLSGSPGSRSGTIICSIVSGGAPTASGTLTKSNAATGDATIAFSASATAAGNPFWISGALNVPQYLTDNAIASPDWFFIALGINDVFNQTTDAGAVSAAASAFANLDLLIASCKACSGPPKVAIVIPPPPSASQDAFGANYACGQTRARYRRNILIWGRELVTKYAGQEGSGTYIVPSNVCLDVVNNMQTAASAPANSRSAVNVVRQSNGVHPATSGYQQIGDAWWAFLKFYA